MSTILLDIRKKAHTNYLVLYPHINNHILVHTNSATRKYPYTSTHTHTMLDVKEIIKSFISNVNLYDSVKTRK